MGRITIPKEFEKRGKHSVGIVLGSGWTAGLSELGEERARARFEEFGMNISLVPGHSEFVSSLEGPADERVLAFGSRRHLYEGFGPEPIKEMIETARELGVERLVLTNGAGSIRRDWAPGQTVLISDHINLTGVSPLTGPSFVDLTDLYSERLRRLLREKDPTLEEGVYVQFRGPSYETPAEVRMAKTVGGDLVGMSTALEAIVARDLGIEVLGVSLITNLAAGISQRPLSHGEVVDAGKLAGPKLSQLLGTIVNELCMLPKT